MRENINKAVEGPAPSVAPYETVKVEPPAPALEARGSPADRGAATPPEKAASHAT